MTPLLWLRISLAAPFLICQHSLNSPSCLLPPSELQIPWKGSTGRLPVRCTSGWIGPLVLNEVILVSRLSQLANQGNKTQSVEWGRRLTRDDLTFLTNIVAQHLAIHRSPWGKPLLIQLTCCMQLYLVVEQQSKQCSFYILWQKVRALLPTEKDSSS